MIRRTLKKIRNFFYWGYRMRDRHGWDYGYLLETMEDFLKEMEVEIGVKGHTKGGMKRAAEIRTCNLLISRILEGDYTGPMWFKVNDSKMTFKRDKNRPEFSELIWDPPVTDQQRKIDSRVFEHEAKQRKQDVDLLFNIMSKKLLTWWD